MKTLISAATTTIKKTTKKRKKAKKKKKKQQQSVKRNRAGLYETEREATAPPSVQKKKKSFHNKKTSARLTVIVKALGTRLTSEQATHSRDVVIHYQNTMHENPGEGGRRAEGKQEAFSLLILTY